MFISIHQSEFVEVESLKVEIIVPGKISKHLLPACEYYMEKIDRFAKIGISHVNLGGDLNDEDANVIMKRKLNTSKEGLMAESNNIISFMDRMLQKSSIKTFDSAKHFNHLGANTNPFRDNARL